MKNLPIDLLNTHKVDAPSAELDLINDLSSYEYHVVDLIKYSKLYLSYAVLKTCPNLDDICTFHWFMVFFLKKMATLRTRNFCQNFMPGEIYYLHTHLKYIGSISKQKHTHTHLVSYYWLFSITYVDVNLTFEEHWFLMKRCQVSSEFLSVKTSLEMTVHSWHDPDVFEDSLKRKSSS